MAQIAKIYIFFSYAGNLGKSFNDATHSENMIMEPLALIQI